MRLSGDVYLGKYEGWYCVNDETFWLESKLVEGRCPTCGREVQWISEDDWFFRLSPYRDRLLEHSLAHPQWVQPRSVYNEMMSILNEGLDDLSISRTSFDWGIPIDGGGVIYVWLDALLNYITAIGWSEDDARFQRVVAGTNAAGRQRDRALSYDHLAGDACGRSGESAPELVFAHGWITVDGEKIGKSLGNAVDPFALAERFGADSLRYFLLREAPVRQRFFVLGREDRATAQQRSRQRPRQSLAAHALDAAALSRRHRAGAAGASDAELARRFGAVADDRARANPRICGFAKRSKGFGSSLRR